MECSNDTTDYVIINIGYIEITKYREQEPYVPYFGVDYDIYFEAV